MLKYLRSSLNRVLATGERESREWEPKLVYRDELSKKSRNKQAEMNISKEAAGRESRIRVKVTMTKRQAERLLAKCKEGGVLEFRDVARELVQMPAGRVAVVSPVEDGLQLQSIPEE